MRRAGQETERALRLVSRRGVVLGGIQLGVIGLIGARMHQMQVSEADQYRLLAEENRVNLRLIPPARGLIYDRNGVVIARNVQNFRVLLVREDIEDLDATIAQVRRLVNIRDRDVERALSEMRRRSAFVPITLADQLLWEDVAELAINAPALPGVTPDVGLSRNYPLGADFAHIVGYVGPVSDYDLERLEAPDPVLQLPKFQIGKIGLERRLEDRLRGQAGRRQIEVNAVGRVMRELSREEPRPGETLQLTIDHGLQNFAQARLAGESAGAVVMDVETGDLLAMASSPSFDPNLFVKGISSRDYNALRDNPYRPLFNKTVQGVYPPGSTLKMMTGLAALRAGVVSPDERITCPGHIELGQRRFHCWKRGGHGRVNMNEAIAQSCDVYFYELALRLGIEPLAALCREFGLGMRHDLPLSAVGSGLIPDQKWKLRARDETWQRGDTVNASIGQGFVLASPLQLAVMSARLATGRAVVPRLIQSVNGASVPLEPQPRINLGADALALMQRAMWSVSNGPGGTAFGARIAAEGLEMAGKTGTSQVRNITAAERAQGVRRNDQLPWSRRDHGLFVAYAPFDRPKYAVAVVVEHGGGGSTAAAPPARDILLYALYGEVPPLEAYPADQRAAIRALQEQLDLRARQSPPLRSSRA